MPQTRFLNKTTPPHVFTLVCVAGLPALAMNMFLPSLPNMAEFFQTDYRMAQLSVPLFMWANALLQIFIGPVSDRFGRRVVLLVSFGIFCLATIGCALSTSIEMFLFFRTTQACVATGIALSRASVRDMFGKEEAASMIGYVTMGMAVAPMLSPILGGYLDETFGWHATFWTMLAIGGFVWLVVWADFGETAPRSHSSMISQFREYPELIRSRRFWGYALTAAFSSGAFFAYVGGAPYVGTEVFGLNPAALGAYFGMTALGYMIGNFLTGRFTQRVGLNRMMTAGSLLVGGGMVVSLILLAAGATHPLAFFGLTCFVGLGNGLTLPNATAGLLSVRPNLAGSASGFGGALMIGGGACLSALSGWLLEIHGGIYPLVFIMIASAVLAILATQYVVWIDRREGALEARAT